MKNIKTCILLCGGKSSRMGEDKGSMIIKHESMIIHILNTLDSVIDEAIIVLNDSVRIAKYEKIINRYRSNCRIGRFNYNIKFVEDEIKDKGPMSGILTGLKNTDSNYNLIIPCDSPYINEEFIVNSFNIINNANNINSGKKEETKGTKINKIDCIIPYNNKTTSNNTITNNNNNNTRNNISSDIKENITNDNIDNNINYNIKLNNSQPLHGIYNKSCISIITNLLESDDRSMKSLIKKVNSYFIKEEDLDKSGISFKNINTKKDLEKII